MSTLRRGARWLNAHMPRGFRRRVAELNRRRRGGGPLEAWRQGLDHEVEHWREVYLSDESRLAWLLNPDRPIRPGTLLDEALRELPGDEVTVLDVGAGPMTPLGLVLGGRRLRVTAVDPLADAYARLLADLGIEPPIPTVPGHGERLREQFPDERFDVAIATNALDHTYDPMAVVENMVAVVRPGGKVLLDHHRNEAERRLYRGLHQWNLDVRDGRLVIWNPEAILDVGERLGARDDVRAYVREGRVRAIVTRGAAGPGGSSARMPCDAAGHRYR